MNSRMLLRKFNGSFIWTEQIQIPPRKIGSLTPVISVMFLCRMLKGSTSEIVEPSIDNWGYGIDLIRLLDPEGLNTWILRR